MAAAAAAVAACAKALLVPSYRSTDFEVHRNWLAVTHSLPLREWYFDETSLWTLDYPPFFAFFEWALSQAAALVDPRIVTLDNLGYASMRCVLFQRTSVVLSELVLLAACFAWAKSTSTASPLLVYAVALHPGLALVDHIHFQYNGVLLGCLLWALYCAHTHRYRSCALIFTALLNAKHLFLYVAPPFATYLWVAYCHGTRLYNVHISRLCILGALVLGTTLLSFGPFVAAGGWAQIPQIASRLFPFGRGLNHAYWAANFWAFFTLADRVLMRVVPASLVRSGAAESASRGLVENVSFGVLPSPTPNACFAIALVVSAAFQAKLFTRPTSRNFIDAIVLSALTSFVFGWHVHEKAILIALVPWAVTAFASGMPTTHAARRAFLLVSASGLVALLPLLDSPFDAVAMLAWTAVWLGLAYASLGAHARSLLDLAENVYCIVLFLFAFYVHAVHWALVVPRIPRAAALPFLPLMATSVLSSFGVLGGYLRLSVDFFTR